MVHRDGAMIMLARFEEAGHMLPNHTVEAARAD
jgi:hypothetical protein